MQIVPITATFTRPADTTAYTANDLVANSVTAGSVVPMTFNFPGANGFKLWRVSVSANSATNTNAKFKLHLYTSSTITCANGDNGAWSTTNSGYIDNVAIDCTTSSFTDNLTGWGTYVNTSVQVPLLTALTSHKIYGLLQATAAYTPTSGEVFTVTLLGESYV